MRPILLALLLGTVPATAFAGEQGRVVEVVDGDTVRVDLGAAVETVRIIGVDTPESVHPLRPVEAFAKEAAAFVRQLALGEPVRLEVDPGTRDRDRYGRLLRHVVLLDGTSVAEATIAAGYGHAYTKYPFLRMERFIALEREARKAGRGLWAPDKGIAARGLLGAAATSTKKVDPIVCVTATGEKYHNCSCRHLKKSSIRMKLSEAASRYSPCKVCDPPQP